MKIAVIGCGVMGSALARHFSKKNQLILCDHSPAKSAALAKELKATAYERVSDAIQEAEVVVLAMKPKDLPALAKSAGVVFTENQLLISVLTGVSYSMLRKYFPLVSVLRIMPSIAMAYQTGVIGLAKDADISQELKKRAEELLQGAGMLAWIPENKMEALTALTGSGPAFIFLLMEAMVEAGIYMGFAPDEAKDLVLNMMEGSLSLIKETGKHPAELKWQVASPAGTTIAGLKAMEAAGVRAGVMNTFVAAYERGKHMKEEHS